ncbi:inositol monophosphatase family protein [Mycobacterium sp. HM-7]
MTAREPESGTAPVALRALAEQLATEAAAFVRRRRGEVFAGAQQDAAAVRTKSSPTDPVTVVDTETERLLRERLAALRPNDAILGEEEGGAARAPAGVPVWVLDPIDGTVNFMYGLGAYAVSVGVQIDGVSVAGAVANAATGEVFSAARGEGAAVTRDGVRAALHCNVIDELPMALVATGFAYARERRRQQAGAVAELLAEVRDIRRVGSCALDLCMVAAGRLDAYFESGVHVWDWAAAALIAEEAGAAVRLPAPGAEDDDLVIAAAPGVSAALAGQLARVGYR